MKTIIIQQEDLAKINSGRRRKFKAVNDPLSAQLIFQDIQEHNRQRVIVICNTVSQAQGLFKDIRDLIETEQFTKNNLETKLLHSRFLPNDRQDKEKAIEEVFGKNWKNDGNCHILIATQVLEVGLNLTCEVMHTQLCPMSSLLQRAGRCARFDNELGEVYIYREIEISPKNNLKAQQETEDTEEEKPEKKRKFLPYGNQVCEDTWTILQKHDFEQVVDFEREGRWINKVHTEEIEQQSKRRQYNRGEFEQQFENAIFRGDRSASRELIRFVNNRNIFVTDEPIYINEITPNQEINFSDLQPFSIPLTTLLTALRDFGYRKGLFQRIENSSGKDKESYSLPVLSEIESSSQLASSVRILVNPNYVFYNQDIGLWINVINPEQENPEDRYKSSEKQQQVSFNQYSYHMDTYLGHLGRMWTCWLKPFQGNSSVREELLEAGGRFIEKYIFETATKEQAEALKEQAEALFDILVFLAIVTHDLGKLQVKWQSAVQGWQEIYYSNIKRDDPQREKFNPQSYLLAHTSYEPEQEFVDMKDGVRKKQKDKMKEHEKEDPKKNKRPPHAIESAFLSREILEFCLFPILQDHYNADEDTAYKLMDVVTMASGRHHSAWTNGWQLKEVAEIEKIELHKDAPAEIQKSWKILSKKLVKLLPDTINFPTEPIFLQQTSYLVDVCRLDCFESDDLEYQQLYSLVVRALRLCDMRSVQLH